MKNKGQKLAINNVYIYTQRGFRIHMVYFIQVYLAAKNVTTTPVKRAIKFIIVLKPTSKLLSSEIF